MNEWIPVAEEEPDYGQTVWLTDGKEIFIGEKMEGYNEPVYGDINKPVVFDGKRWWGGVAVLDKDFIPTHWKPLPDLPT